MGYKLVAIDMDGTLLRDDNSLSKRTIEALSKAKKKGVQIVFATGRMLKSAINYSDSLNLKEPIISCNGAIIIDENRKIIYEKALEDKAIRHVIDIAEKNLIYYHYYGKNTIYGPRNIHIADKFYNQDIKRLENKIDTREISDISELIKEGKSIYKFILLDENRRRLESIKNEIRSIDDISISSSWTNNIEVMEKSVSKGRSLEILCKKLNIQAKDVIAIGDNYNDLDMINFAGLGVAMGNGEDDVKSSADFITDTNNNDGVAKLIEKYIL